MNVSRLIYVLNSAGLELPKYVIKRDGSSQVFDISCIERAVFSCLKSLPDSDLPVSEVESVESRAGVITQACAFGIAMKLSGSPTVESIQNLVEITLLTHGEIDAVRAYMSYRDSRTKTRNKLPAILSPVDHYSFDYQQAAEYAKRQREVFWTPEEIDVNKDSQDLRTNLSKSELHGVVTVLKLFTRYELLVGSEYWLGMVLKNFPRPEIQMMASTFGMMELSVHAPFYNKVSQSLLLDTPEFYNSYVDDPILVDRIKFVEQYSQHDDLLISLAAFTFMEGAVLFSSFAFLKHFQSQGKNLLKNVNAGISFSIRDESLHAEAGAWLFRTLRREQGTSSNYLKPYVEQIADQVLEHECRIVDMIFAEGEISGITSEQLKEFVKHRVKVCAESLGFELGHEFDSQDTVVADWFYVSVSGYQLNDFFTMTGSEYVRTSGEEDFTW